MNNPFFWLGISILLVAISLMALLTVAILVLRELARAARSAEKLLDTLNRELPATLQDIRLTGRDLSGLSDEVTGSVKSARNVVEQVDKGLVEAKVQAQKAQITTRSLMAGATAALRVLLVGKPRRRSRPPTRRPPTTRRPLARRVSEPVSQPPVTTAQGKTDLEELEREGVGNKRGESQGLGSGEVGSREVRSRQEETQEKKTMELERAPQLKKDTAASSKQIEKNS